MLSRFARRADAVLFLALSLPALAISLAAIAASLGHVGRTFPGFVVWDDLIVPPLGRAGWTGAAAGVPLRARVVGVDGRAVASRGDVYDIVRAAPAGTRHDYVFAGAHGLEHRTVPSMVLGRSDWTLTLGVYALNGLAFLAVGLAVFYLKPESRQSRALLAFGVVWGLTLALCPDLFTAGRFGRLAFALEALSPAAILHLGLTFPEPRPPMRRGGRLLVWAYAACLVAGGAEIWLFWRAPERLLAVNNGVYIALSAAGIVAMASIGVGAFRAASAVARRRARVVLAGAIIAFLVPLLALLAFVLLQQPVSFSLLTVAGFVFPLSIGYAVARHDLFEADRFVKLSLVYATMTGLVALGYAGAVLLADRLAAGLALSRSPYFPVGFVLTALATIVPLRTRVQRAVDRLFYRARVDYKHTVARASERMTTLLDREAIVGHVLSTLREVLFIERASVWERHDQGLVRRGASDGFHAPRRIPVEHPGLRVIEARGRILSRDEVEESVRLRDARDDLRALFAALDATLVVPLVHQGRTAGLLAVGQKASGGPLSADDVDVLRTLANEAAVALATAAAVEGLREAEARLGRSERLAAIGELAAAVAHGIRNPLAGIRLTAQLGLESTPPGHPVRENLEDVVSEVDKLEAQVRGILDFARPFEPQLEPADLRAIVASVLQTLGPRLQASHVVVDVDAPASLARVHADPAHLGQAVQELLVNAIEAMGEGGRIAVTAEAAAGGLPRVRLAIADTGPGVPPELRERVFQLFSTTKRTGTGVGLAVVRKIVERHGGTVRLESAPGGGARFVVELPVAPTEAP